MNNTKKVTSIPWTEEDISMDLQGEKTSYIDVNYQSQSLV